MLSVIIPAHDCGRILVRTLACLVPAATAGILREVILADAGSQDDTEAIGDIAGCRFLSLPGAPGMRLRRAAEEARGTWLLFLRPGTVLESDWVAETEMFMASGIGAAATFRPMTGRPASIAGEFAMLLRAALSVRFASPQGLLIAGPFYRQLGGHRDGVADPERDLLRRIGRSRIVLLTARAAMPVT